MDQCCVGTYIDPFSIYTDTGGVREAEAHISSEYFADKDTLLREES